MRTTPFTSSGSATERGALRPACEGVHHRRRAAHAAARAIVRLLAGALFIHILAACGTPAPAKGGAASATRNASPTASRCAASGRIPPGARLAGIDTVAAGDGWVVGWMDLGGTCGLIAHYSDGRWTAVSAPAVAGLNSVRMVSADEGWAVGQRGLILHYSAGVWTRQPSPVATNLSSVAMLSPIDGWIAGDGALLRYRGGQWQPASVAAGIVLYGVSMVSATDGWAVGIDQRTAPNAPTGIILRYDGSHWTPVHFVQPDPSFTYDLTWVDMVSATDGWIVGVAYNGAGDHHSVILHYSAGVWTPVANPSVAGLSGVDMLSATDGWAVGDLILRYSAGAWRAVAGPRIGVTLSAVSMVSAAEGWAVGAQGTILHFQNGAWNVYKA
jgi:photosystem II stability/assembly factor-like uncharacterized protein